MTNTDIVKAIEAVQSMADWMLANGADEQAVESNLNSVEKPLREMQKVAK